MLLVADQYLEAIYLLRREGEDAFAVTLADLFSVSRANAGATLGRLTRDGLVRAEGRRILLTAEGQRRAEAGLRRHLLTECFLLHVLGMGWEQVHEQARSFERGISDLLEERIDARLNYPRVCPHGTPIPRPDQPLPAPDGVPLTRAPRETPLVLDRISELVEHQPALLAFCAAHGLVPGAPICLLPGSVVALSLAGKPDPLLVTPVLATRLWVRPA